MKTRFTQADAIRSVRKTWGFVPVTRIVKDKKKFTRKQKHKKSLD